MPGFTITIDTSQFQKALKDAQKDTASFTGELKVLPKAITDAEKAQREFSSFMTDSSSKIQQLTKRILGLVAAYKAVDALKGIAQRGLAFNSAMEGSRIAIASLITSMVKLENAQGKTLEGAEKYAAAQGLAADMMKEIQKLGLETTATTQELVEGVQSVMGPAVKAGMALKDIPRFAVAGAQAMQTMGIPLQQMRTELEALLSGNINKTQDLLAPRLGITKEDIQRWREAGTLTDELMKKFQAFQLAGQDIAQTWSGLTSNLEEAMDVISGQSATGLTESLKEAIREVQNLIVSSEDGTVGISKDFQNIADLLTTIESDIGQGILSAVRALVEKVKELNQYLGEEGVAEVLERTKGAVLAAGGAYASWAVVMKTKNLPALKEMLASAQAQLTKYTELAASSAQAKSAAVQQAQATVALAQAELEEAKAAQASAQAALAQARARTQAAVTSSQVAKAQALESAAMAALDTATTNVGIKSDALTRAQGALATAMKTTASSVGKLAVAGQGLAALGKNILAFFGGPLGVALMAAGAAAAYLAGKQSLAEEAADLHSKALEKLNRLTSAAAKENQTLAGRLSETNEALRSMAIEEATLGMQKLLASFQFPVDISNLIQFDDALDPLVALQNLDSDPLYQEVKALQEMRDELFQGKGDVNAFLEEVARMYNQLQQNGQASSALGEALKQTLNQGDALRNFISLLEKLEGKIQDVGQTARQAGQEIQNALDEKSVGTVLKALSEEAYYAGLTGMQEKQAKSLEKAGAKLDRVKEILADKSKATEQELSVLNAAAKAYTAIESKKSSGKSDSSMKSALESLQRVREEIAKLNGESAGSGLAQKNREIEELGKKAKYSKGEIEALQTQYTQAFQKDTLDEFNKSLLQAQNNTAKLRELEVAESVQEWTNRLKEAGLSAEEATAKAKELGEALSDGINTQNLETLNSVLKELEEKTGQYGLSLETSNELLETQVKLWRQAGVPEEFINQLREIRELENSTDAWAGISRATQRYYADATNMAKQLEDVTTNAFSSMEDAFVQFATTGKLSFTDLANSIISDLVRISIRSMILAPLAKSLGGFFGGSSGGGGFFGGLFGGSSGRSSYSAGTFDWSNSISSVTGGFSLSSKGNVFSGGNISDFSGSVVTQPQVFSYGSHLTRYAKGAGLMGEAGPEAVMPLRRMSNGKLGVETSGNTGSDVQVIIYNNSGEKTQTKQSTNSNGGKTIEVLIGDVVANQMGTPGTKLNRMVSSQTGTTQPTVRR